MKILQIYKKYAIPTHLQRHMLQTAAIAEIVMTNIQKKLKRELVITTLLLHDMGNIIKFKEFNHFFDQEDRLKIPYYQTVQKQFIKKYGSDADEATKQIMKEIGLKQEVIDLLSQSHPSLLNVTLDNNWENKLLFYSDMRIGPNGITSSNRRFADLKKRYPSEKNFKTYYQKAKTIEKQLQELSSFDLNLISKLMLNDVVKKLEKTTI